jgi:hypothetical protein
MLEFAITAALNCNGKNFPKNGLALTHTHKGRTGIPTTVIAPFAPTCLFCDRRVSTRPLRKGFFAGVGIAMYIGTVPGKCMKTDFL